MAHHGIAGVHTRVPTARSEGSSAARIVSAGLVGGAVSGLIVGGLGGRLAMFLLRLTSDPALRGLDTDDGFTIGVVTASTGFLLMLTAVMGAFGGLVYLAVRSWLPRRARPWLFGALAGLVGGTLIINPGGIDFTRLDPLPLAVGMFIALPAVGAVAMSLVVERLLAGAALGGRWRSLAGLALLAPLALLGVPGLAVVLVIVLALLASRVSPVPGALAASWTSVPMTWLGRTALLAIAGLGAVALARDVSAIL